MNNAERSLVYHQGYIKATQEAKKEFEKKIKNKIIYWENFLKERKCKKGSLDYVRIRVIIEDFIKLKKEAEEK